MSGFGGMIAFDLGSLAKAKRFSSRAFGYVPSVKASAASRR
jgi:hypothetical protein